MAKRRRPGVSVADTVGIYLEEVSSHVLLTADDEVRLARAMEQGRKARGKLDSGESLTSTDRARLYRLVHEGDEAKMAFIRANLR
ncbi:MAG: sigma-70 factor domain-containing protein, partial [Acidimicrobiia bacterium]